MKCTDIKSWVRTTIRAHRDAMANAEKYGLLSVQTPMRLRLIDTKRLLVSEKRKARKMALTTADNCQKLAYLIHDTNCTKLEALLEELETDLKNIGSRLQPFVTAEDFAKVYGKHYWDVDVEVYIYDEDESDITDAEIDMYIHAIAQVLRGEYHFDVDGQGGRGFAFFADDADWEKLKSLLNRLIERGCRVVYPDWYEWKELG